MKTKEQKKTVTIDITDFYEQIKNLAKEDIRTIDEEIRYLIRKGLTTNTSTVRYEYVYPPINYLSKERDNWKDWNTVYCSGTSSSPINETVDVESSVNSVNTTVC